MDEYEHYEDGRDQDDIETIIEPRKKSPAPADDIPLGGVASGNIYDLRTVNSAMIRQGHGDERVANCKITLGMVQTTSNSFGNARLNIGGLPDGEHSLLVVAEDVSSEPVGPRLPIGNGVDNIWAVFEAKLRKSGEILSVISLDGFIEIQENDIRIGLKPLWMRSNASSARGPAAIDTIVLHHTGSNNLRSDLNALVYSGNVSSHYLIPPDGNTIKLVREDRRAWHAGYAHWRGSENINARSVGIEITNSNRAYEPAQLAAVIELLEMLLAEFPTITADRIIGHSDTAINRPKNRPPKRHGRKSSDPGSLFPWEELEQRGWGLVPDAGQMPAEAYGSFFQLRPMGKLARGDDDASQTYGGEKIETIHGVVAELQTDLTKVGYYLGAIDGDFGTITKWALHMFQQHIFSGSRKTDPLNSGDGKCDKATAEMIKRVLGEVEFVGA